MMPRKDSDDEYEYKGRKTRAATKPSVLDSPLRRSSRIKQPLNQDDSSPESISESGSVTGPRSTRRRTTALDAGLPEQTKRLRPRRNSVASDISELTETESLPDGPAKRVTRRSIAGPNASDTPTRLNTRTRRAVRAGSESKSTPPVRQITRRTRASSMEPEVMEELKTRETNTPIKTKRRASVFPTEPDVTEESEDLKGANIRSSLEKTVTEVDEENETEDINNSSRSSPIHNTSNSERRKSVQLDVEEKMEIDESPVRDSEVVVIERSEQDCTELESNYSRVPRKLEDSNNITDSSITDNASDETSIRQPPVSPSKETSNTILSPFNKSIDKQDKSPGNKENEILNVSLGSTDRNIKLANTDVLLLARKSLNSAVVKKPEKRHNISVDNGVLINYNESLTSQPSSPIIAAKIEKTVEGNSLLSIQSKKEYCVDDCVVVLEPMEIDLGSDDCTVETETTKSPATPKPACNNAETKDTEFANMVTADVITIKDEEISESHSSHDPLPIVIDEDDVNIQEKSAEDIHLNVSNGSNEIKISNVVSIVVDENEKEGEQTIEKANEEENEKGVEKEVETEVQVEIQRDVEKNAENEIVEDIQQSQAPPSETDNFIIDTAIVSSSTSSITENISVEKINDSTIVVSSSITIETPDKPAEAADELLSDMPKNDKSSIVTESPAHGTNIEKATNVTETQNKDESAEDNLPPPPASSDPSSAKAQDDEVQRDEANDKNLESSEKDAGMDSDNDSENLDEPLFQDIPAEEWKKTVSDEKKNVEFDTNSVHSSSTERNESECELVLVDKEAWLAAEKERREKEQLEFDYDSDDTVINKCGMIRKKSNAKDQDGNPSPRVIHDATPMDVTSDVEDDDEISSNVVNKSSSKKTHSLDPSTKTDGKNMSLTNKNNLITPKKSPASLNVSRRKSLDKKKSVDDELNKSVTNASFNKSLKNRNSNGNGSRESENNDESSGNEEDVDTSETNTPKLREEVNKRRLDVSVKKSNDGTPSAGKAKFSNGSPEKRQSLNKSASNVESNPIEENSNDSEGSTSNQNVTNFGKFKTKITPMKEEKVKLSEKNVNNDSSDTDVNSQDDTEIDEEQKSAKKNFESDVRELHESLKTQQKLRRSGGSIGQLDSLTDDDDSEKEEVNLNKSDKTGYGKKSKVSKIDANKSLKNSNIGDEDDSQEDPEIDQQKLNRSLKSASAKKSVIHQSYTKLSQSNSSSDVDEKESNMNIENANKSLKSSSSKKSAREQNYSTIAQVNSDSDNPKEEETASSDEDRDISRKIPKYLFSADSSDDEEDLSTSIDEDIAREMNLNGKTSLKYSDDDVPADDCMATESESSDSDDDGADLADFVVDDDDDEELISGSDSDSEDYDTNESKKQRIRILRPESDSDDEMVEDTTTKSQKNIAVDKKVRDTLTRSLHSEEPTAKTPKKGKNLNESIVKNVDVNESPKTVAAHLNKNILLQCSTPKIESPFVDKLKKPKSGTPASKNADSSIKSEKETPPVTKRLSKSVTEKVETPSKLHSSFNDKRTSKTSVTPQRLDTSLPIDISNPAGKTNLSKSKLKKISLHQTMLTPNSESPETRFLMKEKLSDTLPPLKLQPRTKASRRSVLDNVTEDTGVKNNEDEFVNEHTSVPENKSLTESKAVDTTQKKKKKKKTKSEKQLNIKEVSENENVLSANESARHFSEENTSERIEEDVTKPNRKSKKRNKKNKSETMEIEEPMEIETVEDVPKKKKKKSKNPEIVKEEQPVEINKMDDKKKKKKNKKSEIVEPEQPLEISKTEKTKKKNKQQNEIVELVKTEVIISKKKRSRDTAKNVAASDSNDAPESIGFTEARDEALKNLKKVTESIKAGQDARKKKHQENIMKVQQNQNVTSQTERVGSLKRLPDDLLDSLTEVAERPKKRRKITWDQKKLSSKVTFSPNSAKSENVEIDEGFIPLSTSGGTTNFAIVNLKKATKHPKKNVVVRSFRERMLARNPRQPVSAFLMYQQKQRASGKDRSY